MKKLFFTAAVILGCLSFKVADAQVHLSVGVNIGSQPEWGPVGYDHADYYYMPDIDAYYDVPAHQYVYYENNVWVRRPYLPARYSNYDIYHGYKVVVNERQPWLRDNIYRTKYAGYRGRHDQVVIRDSHDERYRNHWHQDNGNHYGERQRGGDQRGGYSDQGDRGDHGRGHGDQGGDHGRGHGDQGGDRGHGDHGDH